MMQYYVERECNCYRRIFRQNQQTKDIDVANYAEFQANGIRTRWYHFAAELPWHASLIGIPENA